MQQRTRTARWLGLAAGVFALVAARPAPVCLDADLYGRILREYTAPVPDTAGVRVDYARLVRAPEWRRLVDGLTRCDPDALPSRAERLSFWINAYNILAIDVVVRNYPLESIRDVGWFLRPVWKREAATIYERSYSLGEIEHDILRPLGEPRIHAAIVCASTSCPSLRREPYDGSRLDGQLDDALRTWLANPGKGARLDEAGDVLYLSRIFDWFDGDFASRGGVPKALEPYLPEEIRGWLRRRGGAAKLRYLDYDWRLNDLARTPSGARGIQAP